MVVFPLSFLDGPVRKDLFPLPILITVFPLAYVVGSFMPNIPPVAAPAVVKAIAFVDVFGLGL